MLSEPLLPHKAPRLAISCVCSANESTGIMAAVAAVERTARCIDADRLYWFSNQPFPNELEGMDIVNVLIPTFTDFCEDINRIYLRLMPEVVTTDFNLTVQPDGFAVNPQSWDDRFWEYDYIGAAWVEKLGPGPLVGNGGFSLRSQKLSRALLDLQVKWRLDDWRSDERLTVEPYYSISSRDARKWLPEDLIISMWYRNVLENEYGVRFCPPELANKFSVETVHPFTQYWVGRSFGFHGLWAAPHYGVTL